VPHRQPILPVVEGGAAEVVVEAILLRHHAAPSE
jgi:hypothetical protein